MQCYVCGIVVSCSINRNIKVCEQCVELDEPCELLECGDPYRIIKNVCHTHKSKEVYYGRGSEAEM